MQLIVTIVERAQGQKVVKAAQKAGATGATSFYGRGAPESEIRKFLSLAIESSKEIILILAQEQQVENLLMVIREAGELDKPGRGILFTVPVGTVIGLENRTNS